MATPPSQSVFDALAAGSSKGSWADRIKSVDKPTVPLPAVNAAKPTATSKSQSSSSQSAKPAQSSKPDVQDHGEWQQVVKPVARKQASTITFTEAKQQGQSQGSASRDWRDRTEKAEEANEKKVKAPKRATSKKSSSDPSETVAVGESAATTGLTDALSADAAPTPAPVSKTTAPAVNPWAARKEKMSASASIPIAPKSNGAAKKLTAPKLNGITAGMSSTKKVGKGQASPLATDDVSWPDVAKAAEAVRTAEREKEKKAKADEATAADAASNTGKKHKWTAISPLELQAAADKAAENARRQAKADQPRKKSSRNDLDAESSPSRPATRPSSRKPSISSPTKKGVKLPVQSSQKKGKDSKINTPASEFSEADGGRRGSPSKGSNAGSVLGLDTATVGEVIESTVSRPISGQSQPSSPLADQSAAGEATEDGKTFKGAHASNANLANGRGGRGGRHDGGRGYGGRGRGAYRNGHLPGGPRGVYTSPNYPNGQLPADAAYGQDYGYAYGFAPGYGYGGAYPLQIGGRAMPPPPMPVTQVQGLDFLRICLLGQVEYYFGMQNLAMDFFLRQQMDSEGWIDISMISSFNRVKSLTPDVALVREMMLLSSVLEVKDNFVRLAGGEAKRWVLPDARLSTIQSDKDESTIENGGEAMLGVPEDDAHERWSTPNGGVESALLKSVPVSSSVSVDDSDAVKEDTPATSMSGDHDNREEMEMKTIGAAVDALTAQQ